MKSASVTALVIDDSPTLILQLQYLLQELHASTEVAAGTRQLPAVAGSWSVIFVELVQAAGNGFQMLRELATSADCPLILLSGTTRTSDHAWALQAGAAAVLRRPLVREQLEHCLRALAVLPSAKQG